MVHSDPLGWPQHGASFPVEDSALEEVPKSSLYTRVLSMQRCTCPSIDCIRAMCILHRALLHFLRVSIYENSGWSFVAETSWAPHHARALKTQKQITQMVKQPCGDDCFRSRTNVVRDDST